MSTRDFITRNGDKIASLWKTFSAEEATYYGVVEQEFAERLAAIALRSNGGGACSNDGAESNGVNGRAGDYDIASGIKADELCLAIACEKGDNAAWMKFETDYRHSMVTAARVLTKDEAEADDLTQFVFGELYGIKLDGDRRISKLSHYSGRGSLGGWLRAVIYQCFIDRKRQSSRFEQVEENEEFDRLAAASSVSSTFLSRYARPDDFEDYRLREATEEAISQAIKLIDIEDRLLLNYYYFDKLTLKEIGQILRVHEATISRRLARATKKVKKKTEEVLKKNYGLRRAEVNECMHIAARTELDMRKLLS